MQRSGSLKEISSTEQPYHRPVHNQLSYQYQQFNSAPASQGAHIGVGGMTPQEMMMQQQYIQQQQQQINYYQQLHQQQILQQQQQHEILLRQQQEMEMAAMQQQLLQQQAIQQQQQQELALRQQQEEAARQQQQKEEAARQHQMLHHQQQQKEEYVRQRHEQYARLKKLKDEEEQAKIRMEKIMIQKQKILDDDFNPRESATDARMCHSVEPPSVSTAVRGVEISGRVSPSPFEDDFSQSSPDLSNPFKQRAADDNLNPFEMKKKTHQTHHRSRSDTFGKLAIQRSENPSRTINGKQPSPRLSPIPSSDASKPLTIDTSDSALLAGTEGPN
ncbi:MAG: hypothetical protein AAF587_40815, partial [Bacteroidota bacterium]